MNHIHDKINQDTITDLHSMIAGNVSIEGNSILIIHGMIIGSLTISESYTAEIHGMVNGDIHNNGKCDIFGTIYGKLFDNSNWDNG